MTDRRHEREIPGYEGDIEELARLVGRLTYDQTAKFIKTLGHELREQSEADQLRGRPKLAGSLFRAAGSIEYAAGDIDRAWEISAPHMTPEERGEV